MLFSPHYQKFLTFQGKRGTHVIRRPTGCGPAQASRRCNMPSAGKTILLCLALLLAERAAAAQVPGPQTGALPPADVAATQNAITLPEVTVLAPRPFPQPYSDGGGPRVSSYSEPRSEHYVLPPGYEADAALHPYTSELGPRASSNGTVRPEHYDVPPDYERNMAMHPYTSGFSPCVQGRSTGSQLAKSHHNQ
jgi:hypothetical protein